MEEKQDSDRYDLRLDGELMDKVKVEEVKHSDIRLVRLCNRKILYIGLVSLLSSELHLMNVILNILNTVYFSLDYIISQMLFLLQREEQ